MEGWTQEEIAEEFGVDKASVSRFIDDLLQNRQLSELQQIAADHKTDDFDVPLYNVWKQQQIGKNYLLKKLQNLRFFSRDCARGKKRA